jgi:hypothetical protein
MLRGIVSTHGLYSVIKRRYLSVTCRDKAESQVQLLVESTFQEYHLITINTIFINWITPLNYLMFPQTPY